MWCSMCVGSEQSVVVALVEKKRRVIPAGEMSGPHIAQVLDGSGNESRQDWLGRAQPKK
jgi:hypothetical protein